MNNIMVEELLPECVEEGTHIVVHKVPQWHMSDDITNTPTLIAPYSPNCANSCEVNDGSSLLLNTLQQKQLEEPQFSLEVSDESLKMDLVVLNKDNFLQVLPQQDLTVVNDLPLDHLVDTIMTYSCRLCMFVAADVAQLLQHFSTSHCLTLPQVMLDDAPSIPPTDSVIEHENTAEQIQENTAEQKQENATLDNFVFVCGFCTSNFNSLDDCKQHMLQVHGALPAQSKDAINVVESTDQSQSSQNVEKQKREEENKSISAKKKKLRCTVPSCFHKFSTEDRRQLHISCHVSGKRREFQCSKCNLQMERWNQCALHLWYNHKLDADLLSCPTCEQYKTVTQVKLKLHMKVHSDLKPYVCSVCNKGFKQPSQLRNHRVMHVDKKLADSDIPRWYTSQSCLICHKTYSDSRSLKKHMKCVHSKLRPYACQVCGHTSSGKTMLQMHMRQHTGHKPYKCTEESCDFRTGDHNSLRRHMMRHTGKRPYVCPHCPYSAIQSSAYKSHLRIRHPDAVELYTCSLCPYHTVSAENLAHHETDHKHGLITPRPSRSTDNGDCEVFPGNVAAAHLIYRCFNPDTSCKGSTMKASLTGSQTSPDGSTQTIMIQIPAPDDDDNSHCFLEEEDGSMAIDTGGITIPADPEPFQDVNLSSIFPTFNTPLFDTSQAASV